MKYLLAARTKDVVIDGIIFEQWRRLIASLCVRARDLVFVRYR